VFPDGVRPATVVIFGEKIAQVIESSAGPPQLPANLPIEDFVRRFGQLRIGLDGDHEPRPYLVTPYFEANAKVSPDGKWASYESDESGRPEVYVQSFPVAGSKYQVTTRGGFNFEWSRDGRSLYFGSLSDTDAIFAVDVLPGPQFRLGSPRVVGRVPKTTFDADVTRNQDRLLSLVPSSPVPPGTITIVENWPSLLDRR
jgi:hypothetical protein